MTVTLLANSSAAAFVPASLTFTSTNWNATQTVSVTAINNSLVDGTRGVRANASLASTDAVWAGLAVPPLFVTVFDNDVVSSLGPSCRC